MSRDTGQYGSPRWLVESLKSREALSPEILVALLEMAHRERVFSTVADALDEKGWLSSLSDPLREKVQSYRRQSLVSQAARDRQAQGAVAALAAAGIPVVLIKGLALREVAYHEPGGRETGDCDLLIMQRDAERAVSVLESHDFLRAAPDQRPDDWYLKHHHHLVPLRHQAFPFLVVELHTHAVQPSTQVKREPEAIFRDARRESGGFGGARLPSVADLFWITCVHAVWAAPGRRPCLRGLQDVLAVAGTPGSQEGWDGVWSTSAAAGVAADVALAVLLAEAVFPGRIEAHCRSRAATALSPRQRRWLPILVGGLDRQRERRQLWQVAEMLWRGRIWCESVRMEVHPGLFRYRRPFGASWPGPVWAVLYAVRTVLKAMQVSLLLLGTLMTARRGVRDTAPHRPAPEPES